MRGRKRKWEEKATSEKEAKRGVRKDKRGG